MKTSLTVCCLAAVSSFLAVGTTHAFVPLVGRVTRSSPSLVLLRDRLTADNDVQQGAQEALSSVGWALPNADGDLTADDPFVQQIDAGVRADVGVPLDALLNPAKVVNLERDLYQLRSQLADATGQDWNAILEQAEAASVVATAVCDGGGGGPDAESLRGKIQRKEADLSLERRSVFRGWLKNVFLVQAVLSFGLSYVMATDPQSLFGGFGWFYSYNMDVSITVLGYWWWWLFVVPSLRSRRPTGAEKKALDLAFVGTPLISLLAPVATKDTAVIWALNLAVVVASYGYAFVLDANDDDIEDDGEDGDGSTPGWLKFAFKSLDFGSGRERGARN